MSSQTRAFYAPIGYYARLIWLLGIVILTFILFILDVSNRSVQILFYLSLPFSFAWWTGNETPTRPPPGELIARIAVGFTMGLGGLWFFAYLLAAVGRGSFRLWGIPTLPSSTLAVVGTSTAILLQVGVGIVEEGTFRVALPRLMMGAQGRHAGAFIFLSSWIFGLFHWTAYGGDLTSILVAVFAGLIQAMAYFTSREILGVMLGHTILNLWVGGLLSSVFQGLALVLILIGAYHYLLRRKRK